MFMHVEFTIQKRFWEGKNDEGTLRVVASDMTEIMYLIPGVSPRKGLVQICTVKELHDEVEKALHNPELQVAWDDGQDITVKATINHELVLFDFSVAPSE